MLSFGFPFPAIGGGILLCDFYFNLSSTGAGTRLFREKAWQKALIKRFIKEYG